MPPNEVYKHIRVYQFALSMPFSIHDISESSSSPKQKDGFQIQRATIERHLARCTVGSHGLAVLDLLKVLAWLRVLGRVCM